MGTWGYEIFSDDTASDVRNDYQELLGEGLTGPEATDKLLREWQYRFDDPDDEDTPFWLGLAVTQWECGRLEDRVKEKAIRIIDEGFDLLNYDNPEGLKEREIFLKQAREQLLSPQPPEKSIPKAFKSSTDWKIGEVVSYRLRSGKFILMKVVGYHTDKGGTDPLCALLDWSGDNLPDQRFIKRLAIRPFSGGWSNDEPYFILGGGSESEYPTERVTRLNLVLRSWWKKRVNSGFVFLWRYLDDNLEKMYGLS